MPVSTRSRERLCRALADESRGTAGADPVFGRRTAVALMPGYSAARRTARIDRPCGEDEAHHRRRQEAESDGQDPEHTGHRKATARAEQERASAFARHDDGEEPRHRAADGGCEPDDREGLPHSPSNVTNQTTIPSRPPPRSRRWHARDVRSPYGRAVRHPCERARLRHSGASFWRAVRGVVRQRQPRLTALGRVLATHCSGAPTAEYGTPRAVRCRDLPRRTRDCRGGRGRRYGAHCEGELVRSEALDDGIETSSVIECTGGRS